MLKSLKHLAAEQKSTAILIGVISFGLFLQLTGFIWINDKGIYQTQVYLWLSFPALILAIKHLISQENINRLTAPILIIIIFFCYSITTSLWATDPDVDLAKNSKKTLHTGLYILSIWLIAHHKPQYLNKILILSLIVITAGALATMIYQFGILDRPMQYRAYRLQELGWKGFADFEWPTIAGFYYGAFAICALWFYNSTNDWRKSAFYFICFSILSIYVFFTYARGAWIPLAAASFLLLLLRPNRKIIALAVIAFIALIIVGYLGREILFYEVVERNLTGRPYIWLETWQLIQDKWLLGYGLRADFSVLLPNGFTVIHAHSLYLQTWYETGLIGLLLLIAILVTSTKQGWLHRTNNIDVFALSLIAYTSLIMLVDLHQAISRPDEYWTLIWLPIAIVLRPRKNSANALNI